jgi:TRAP-type C4-dicarboxylate transport system substrate-binding protein
MFLKRLAGLGLAAAVALGATVAAAQEVTLRYSSWLPVGHWLVQEQFVPWFAEIEKVTEGRVKVEVLPKTVGTALSQYDVVRDGLADMSFIIPAYTPGRFPLIEMGELPLLGDDASKMSLVFERIYRKHFLELNEFEGIFPITMWNITAVQPFNNRRPITRIEDLKGLKLRSPNGIITATLTSLGGVPILKSSMEAFEMLSTGAIDGQITQADTVVVNNATGLMKYATVVPGGMANSAHIMAINPDKWAEISEQDQKAILAITVEKLGHSVGTAFHTREVDGMKVLADNNYEIVTADKAFVDGLKEVVRPIEEEWIKRAKDKGVADPEAVLAEFRAEIAKAEQAGN